MKQAILFLSDKSSPWIIQNFQSLASAETDTVDVFFLYHERNQIIPEQLQALSPFTFTHEVLYELGYTPVEESLIPGSNHFPLLKFYLVNPQYDFYWMIEDDVHFNGSWETLFNAYEDDPTDFISALIRKYAEFPNWYWWHTLQTSHQEKLPPENLICSFNPVYRLTNRALVCIDNALKNGWSGHHEVVLPTLLYNKGFTLMDMGGIGTFVPDKFKNRFYMNPTMSHLPMEPGSNPNCLYHPVKEKKTIDPTRLKKNCVVSAVGKNSLHREWMKENPDFDLHLIVYDDSYNKYYNDTDFICFQSGYKLKLVYDYLQQNPEYLKKYNYFFLPDDDIQMDAPNISELFRLMEEYHLQIAQPALSDSYYTHEQTLRDSQCLLRYTNFVEMMAPCFSKEALNRVLFTFNANESGWGIEYHWPELIDFTGREMAIIDVLYAIHTRPIQSQKLKNKIELDQYVKENDLRPVIVETGHIPLHTGKAKQLGGLVTDRKIHAYLNHLIGFISYNLMNLARTSSSYSIGIHGLTGISLLMAHHHRISEKRDYLDTALSLVEKSGGGVKNIRENMDFKEGLTGFSWYIEYLAQHEFIENDTDEILEEINEYITNWQPKETMIPDVKELIALAWHYIARMNNPHFENHTELHSKEKERLTDILQQISNWSKTLSLRWVPSDAKRIIDCIFLLCETRRVYSFAGIDSTLQQLMKILTSCNGSLEVSYLQKAYAILLASDSINDYELKEQTIQEILLFKDDKEGNGFQRILNIYLLHRIYLFTNLEILKDRAFDLLCSLIYEEKEKPLDFAEITSKLSPNKKSMKMSDSIRAGLIIASILLGREMKLDHCIL